MGDSDRFVANLASGIAQPVYRRATHLYPALVIRAITLYLDPTVGVLY